MEKENIFKRLVSNGFDFLTTAIFELEKKPKYSVIHFYAALELFVKARLLKEHWSLVVTKRKDPDWDGFIKGDFVSVSLKEAALKLKKIVKSEISRENLGAFEAVARHRNKLIHFFYDTGSKKENAKLTRQVVKQQLAAWYYLHKLLTVQWKEVFSPWETDIIQIDRELKKFHGYLQAVFDDKQDRIKDLEKKGKLFEECPSCGFKSQHHESITKFCYDATCLVCGLIQPTIRIECGDCGNIMILEEGFSKCSSCGFEIEPEDLANRLIDEAAAFADYKDGGDSYSPGNCGFCDGYNTVVRTEKDQLVCTCCFELFDSLQFCQFCGDPNTDDMTASYSFGCNHCDGSLGQMKDE